MGGWSDKTKLILISTLVEVEAELGNNNILSIIDPIITKTKSITTTMITKKKQQQHISYN